MRGRLTRVGGSSERGSSECFQEYGLMSCCRLEFWRRKPIRGVPANVAGQPQTGALAKHRAGNTQFRRNPSLAGTSPAKILNGLRSGLREPATCDPTLDRLPRTPGADPPQTHPPYGDARLPSRSGHDKRNASTHKSQRATHTGATAGVGRVLHPTPLRQENWAYTPSMSSGALVMLLRWHF